MSNNREILNSQVTRKNRVYSEATRLSHVSGWRASGLSISRYSTKHGISVSALSKWIKYYGDKLPETSFKEVSLENATLNCQVSYVGSMIEIKMPNGIQLKMALNELNWAELLGVLSRCI